MGAKRVTGWGGGPDFDDINCFSVAIGSESAWRTYYRLRHGLAEPPCPWLLDDYHTPRNGVEFSDIRPFAASLGRPCVPYVP